MIILFPKTGKRLRNHISIPHDQPAIPHPRGRKGHCHPVILVRLNDNRIFIGALWCFWMNDPNTTRHVREFVNRIPIYQPPA